MVAALKPCVRTIWRTLALGLSVPVLLVACMYDYAGIAKSWEGKPLDDLIFAWGPPSAMNELEDGRKVALYAHSRQGGGFVQLVGTTNPTAVFHQATYECAVLFRADEHGIIASADGSGNIGGCNRLFRGKSRAGS